VFSFVTGVSEQSVAWRIKPARVTQTAQERFSFDSVKAIFD
jgi:hypothetical protein